MEKVAVNWTPRKLRSMEESRGRIKGFVAVVAVDTDDGIYATLATIDECNRDSALEGMRGRLSPDVLVYALMPSSHPSEVAGHALRGFYHGFFEENDRKTLDGLDFHVWTADHAIRAMREAAWELFAEQHSVSIHDTFGVKA